MPMLFIRIPQTADARTAPDRLPQHGPEQTHHHATALLLTPQPVAESSQLPIKRISQWHYFRP